MSDGRDSQGERLPPRARCASCGEIFAADVLPDDRVTCPACGVTARPGGVMRVSLPPSLGRFARNWQRAKEWAAADEEG